MATSYSAQKAEEKKKIDQMFNKNIEQINKNYDAGIDDLSKKYDDQQRAVAVQKLINERKVAESMANLGVTDSGLNRTQQTAVQLSAANQAYNLNRQKQADIDAYNLERDNRIAEIEQSRLSSHLSLDDKYLQLEESAKAAQAQAEAEVLKGTTQIISKDNGLLSRNYKGTLAENGITVEYDRENNKTTYIDRNTGYKSTFNYNTNPYTNTVNPDTAYGVWENGVGYQPNNIMGVGLTKKDTIDNELTGLTQNVFFCSGRDEKGKIVRDANGKSIAGYYIWWAPLNSYVKVESTTEITSAGRKKYWDVVDPRVTNSK